MPDQLDQNVVRAPGQMVYTNISMAPRQGVSVGTPGTTIATSFDQIKHLLSAKPLHRPSRTRPLEK